MRYKITSKLWENTPAMLQLPPVRGGRERARHRGGPLGPRRETTQGGGRHRRRHDRPADLYAFDVGSYHVAVPGWS